MKVLKQFALAAREIRQIQTNRRASCGNIMTASLTEVNDEQSASMQTSKTRKTPITADITNIPYFGYI
jgi:hypothetical protein